MLPFADLSEKKDQEFFSDGLTEELLDLLAKTPWLQVIARKSSFSFKGKSDDIPTIARKLNVANILEGSVRKSGIRLRVTTQLIRADTGVHVWSETYDREVRDVFKVQDEIAGAITRVLTHRLLGGDEAGKSNSPKAMDQVAYLLYLEGQHEFRPHTKEGTEKAIELFKQVTVLQPDFSDGFAALGAAYLNNAEDHKERTDLIPAAGAALARALLLDPTNLRAVSSHLDLALHARDWPSAAADARRMKAINPYSATTLGEMFRYYQLLGFPDLALDAARGAAALDPLSFVRRLNVAAALLRIARYPEGAAAALSALELQPKHVFMLSLLCTADAYSGRVGDARAIAAELSLSKDPDDRDGCLFDIVVAERRLADARKLNDTMAARFPGGSNQASDLAANYAEAHEFDLAATWLERGYDKKDFAIFTVQFTASIPRAFFDTDRWKKFLRRPMTVAWQQAHDRLAAELAAEGQKPASGI